MRSRPYSSRPFFAWFRPRRAPVPGEQAHGRPFAGLRARIGLIVVIHALLLVALSVTVIETGQQSGDAIYLLPSARDVTTITRAVDAVPVSARAQVVAALNGDRQRVRLLPALPQGPNAVLADDQTLPDVLSEYARQLGGRGWQVRAAGRIAYGFMEARKGFSLSPIRVMVALKGGGAVEIERTTIKRLAAFVNHFTLLIAGLLLVDVLVVFALAALTTVPVERLVRAVRRDDEHGLLVRGPAELRELGAAFHEMRARLHRLLEERTRMIAAVAHDYRTYLTRLELRADFLDDEAQRAAIRADLGEMRVLLDDTLTFARQGRSLAGEDLHARVDLVEALQTAVDLRQAGGEAVRLSLPSGFESGASGSSLRASGSSLRASAMACATPVAVQRMVANLLDNAIRYGGGSAHVVLARGDGSAKGQAAQGAGWQIRVEDRGPGVPEAEIAHLAQPYHRLESSRARATGGVGLGLSIVEALAHRFGGTFTLGNRPEGGLRAVLWLREAA